MRREPTLVTLEVQPHGAVNGIDLTGHLRQAWTPGVWSYLSVDPAILAVHLNPRWSMGTKHIQRQIDSPIDRLEDAGRAQDKRAVQTAVDSTHGCTNISWGRVSVWRGDDLDGACRAGDPQLGRAGGVMGRTGLERDGCVDLAEDSLQGEEVKDGVVPCDWLVPLIDDDFSGYAFGCWAVWRRVYAQGVCK